MSQLPRGGSDGVVPNQPVILQGGFLLQPV